jgi:ferritin
LTAESNTAEEMLDSLNLQSEHSALEAINKLEAAAFAWKDRMTAQVGVKSPVRTPWSFVKDPVSEFEKMESLLDRTESLLQQLKSRYPNLPQTFLDSTKIQFGKVSSSLDL